MNNQNNNTNNYAPIVPLESDNCITPLSNKNDNDEGPLNAPIKPKKKRIINQSELETCKKKLRFD